jgi:hypothetical protein
MARGLDGLSGFSRRRFAWMAHGLHGSSGYSLKIVFSQHSAILRHSAIPRSIMSAAKTVIFRKICVIRVLLLNDGTRITRIKRIFTAN